MKLPKLNPKQTLIASVAGSLVLVGGWYMLRFQGVQDRLTEAHAQLENTESLVQQARMTQRGLPKLKAEVAEFERKRGLFLESLPSTTQYGDLTAQARRAVGVGGASVKTVRFSKAATVDASLPAGVSPVMMSFDLQGNFAQIFDSVRALEGMSRFSNISSMRLNMPAPNATDPLITSAVDLRVYTYDEAAAQERGRLEAAKAARDAAAQAAPQEGEDK